MTYLQQGTKPNIFPLYRLNSSRDLESFNLNSFIQQLFELKCNEIKMFLQHRLNKVTLDSVYTPINWKHSASEYFSELDLVLRYQTNQYIESIHLRQHGLLFTLFCQQLFNQTGLIFKQKVLACYQDKPEKILNLGSIVMDIEQGLIFYFQQCRNDQRRPYSVMHLVEIQCNRSKYQD